MKVILLFLLLQFTACSAYLENRQNDLTDSLSINTSAIGVGAKIDLGPLSTGFYELGGFMTSTGQTTKFGLGGVHEISYIDKIELVGIDLASTGSKKAIRRDLTDRHTEVTDHNSRWGYGHEILPFAAFKFDIGYITTLGVQIDLLEIIDLVLGLVTIDIMQDDSVGISEYAYKHKDKSLCPQIGVDKDICLLEKEIDELKTQSENINKLTDQSLYDFSQERINYLENEIKRLKNHD